MCMCHVSHLLIDFRLKFWTLLIARKCSFIYCSRTSFPAAQMDCTFQNARFYCFVELKNKSTPLQIHRKLLEAFPDSCPAYSTIKLWCRDFISGKRKRFDDKERPGRPKSARMEDNVAEVKRLIQENPRHSTRSISHILNINKTTVLRILKDDLKMRKLCSVWIPKLLNDDHRQKRMESAKCILNELSSLGDNAPSRYCVEDETWVNFNPLLPKQENKTWVETSAKRHAIPRPALTKKKNSADDLLNSKQIFCESASVWRDHQLKRLCRLFENNGREVEKTSQWSGKTQWVILPAWQCEATFRKGNERLLRTTWSESDYPSRLPYSSDFNILDLRINCLLKTKFKHSTIWRNLKLTWKLLSRLRDIYLLDAPKMTTFNYMCTFCTTSIIHEKQQETSVQFAQIRAYYFLRHTESTIGEFSPCCIHELNFFVNNCILLRKERSNVFVHWFLNKIPNVCQLL